MSESMARVTLTKTPEGVTYQCMITCSTGDVRQLHNDNGVIPDFTVAANRPVLTFHCLSSAASTGETYPANVSLYYDGTKLTTNASGLTADGMFQTAGGVTSPITVTILKNYALANSANQPDHVLKMVCQLATGQTVQAEIPLTSGLLSESGEFVSIIDAGTGTSKQPFVVDQNVGNTCVLKAQIYKGGNILSTTTGYTFQWQKMGVSGWQNISGATAQTHTVNASDIESYAEYRLVVTHTASGNTFSDTQSVMDVGDPYFLAITCKDSTGAGADFQFAAGEAETSVRVLTAVLYDRKNNQTASKSFTNKWQLVKPDGVILNTSAVTCGTVTIPAQSTDVKTITIPNQYLTDNGITSMDVYAVATY
ncbi:MAG: hypothetical protein K2N88_05140 [Muribaculaceae bacterium]|nr:hypothetical protein [Muribaculaceae bacterium]